MKNVIKKWSLIIICSFVFVYIFSVVYSVRKDNKLYADDEMILGDTKSSCATKDYDKCRCDSMGPGRDYCRKQCSYCKTCGSDSELHSDGYCYKKSTSTSKPTITSKPSTKPRTTPVVCSNISNGSACFNAGCYYDYGRSECMSPTPTPPPAKCSKGYYLPANSGSCKKCDAGSYCTGGTFAASNKAQGISDCEAGWYSEAGASKCTKCPTDYTSKAKAISISKCYRQVSGGKSLLHLGTTDRIRDCSAGTSSITRDVYYGNSSICDKCDAGKYQDKPGQTSCETCKMGYYSAAGAVTCTVCPDGTMSNSKRDGCDKCIMGTACKSGERKFCGAGTYSENSGSSDCSDCSQGYISRNMLNTKCEKCTGNTISVDGKKCEPCDPGTANDDHTECLTDEESIKSIKFTEGPTTVGAMGKQSFTYAVDVKARWSVSGEATAGAGCNSLSKTCEVIFQGGCSKSQKSATITATANKKSVTKKVKIMSYNDYWTNVTNEYGPVNDAFLKSREQMKTSFGCYAFENMRKRSDGLYYTAYTRCCDAGPSVANSKCYYKKGNGTDNEYCYGTSSECAKSGYSKRTDLGSDTCGEDDKCYIKDGQHVVGKFEGQNGYILYSQDPSKCKTNVASCYGNTRYLSDATAVKFVDVAEGIYRFKYNGVLKKDCVVTPPSSPVIPECKDKNIEVLTKVDDCKKCNDHITKGVENTICDTAGSFYKINSAIKYDISFNNNVSSDIIAIKSGLGFPFTIKVKAEKTVTGVFNYEDWEKEYYKTRNIWKNTTDMREKYSLENKMDEFEKIVDGFNESIKKYDNKLDPNISFDINTSGTGKKENLSFQIVSSNVKDSEPKAENKVFFTRYKEINGSDLFESYENFEYKVESEVVLKPTEVYLNKVTGELSDKGNLLAISGGHKIYTSELKEGKYPIYIKINNVDGLAEIKNESCILNVLNPDLKYRIVDVVNPFINNSYEKGENWYNKDADFTSVIKNDTWSTSTEPLYVFKLDSDSIEQIKRDNRSDKAKNKYLGTCYLPDSIVGNEIKSIICDKIK